jgi:8-oxo-dGTP diphosphatase
MTGSRALEYFSDGMPPRKKPDERAFVEAYRPDAYPRPAVTVDLVVLTVLDADLKLLLVRRAEPPFQGQWALPGGFVRVGDGKRDRGEDLDEAAARELEEETALPHGSVFLQQLGAFGAPDRDPRMRVISVAYFALIRPDLAPLVHAGGDVDKAGWHSVSSLAKTKLAFDHARIVDAALGRVRETLDRSTLAFELVPRTFTIPELRAVFDAVTGEPHDPGNFRRKFGQLLETGMVVEAPGKRVTGGKPARVYAFGQRRG